MIEQNMVERMLQKTRGLDLLREVVSNPQNIVIPIGTCELKGFVYDMFTEHRAPSVRLEMPDGSIRTTAPSEGEYYFGFLFYDTGETNGSRSPSTTGRSALRSETKTITGSISLCYLNRIPSGEESGSSSRRWEAQDSIGPRVSCC